MTTITYDDTKLFQQITLSGHAEDRIVCAGISAISQTLLANLLREEGKEQVRFQWTMNEPGQIWMRAWPTDEARESVRAMFRFTMEGLRHIAEDYPGNIEIKEERKNGGI